MSSYKGDPKELDLSAFENGMTGECLCGSIRITIKKKDLFTRPNGHLCHCMNCRKSSGCVASNNMVIEKENVQIEDPKSLLKTYNDSNTGSGLTTPRSFCSNCGRYERFRFSLQLSRFLILCQSYLLDTHGSRC